MSRMWEEMEETPVLAVKPLNGKGLRDPICSAGKPQTATSREPGLGRNPIGQTIGPEPSVGSSQRI